MASIHETIDRYESVCTEAGQKPLPYVIKQLRTEKDEAVTDYREHMHLRLAGNDKLKTEARLTDTDVEILYKALRNNLYVTSLDLRYNNITDEGAKHIALLIQETPALLALNLMCNDFGEAGAQDIAKALQENETLQLLRLNGNKIGNKGGMCFAAALQVNVTLEKLDLGDTDLKTESVIALATVLNYNTSLKVLVVNRPILFSQQEETTVHFARMLKVNKSLKELHLMKQEIRDFGATRLSECLMDNFTLTYLNLSCNRITRDGAKELAKLLKNDTSLRVLDLGYNRLEDDGALCIAQAVATYNTNLEVLVLVSNNICGRGLCAIADSMKLNSSLHSVYIWGNHLEESACIAFANIIDTGRLELENTDISPYVVDGVTKLSELSHGIRQHYYWTPSYGGDINTCDT